LSYVHEFIQSRNLRQAPDKSGFPVVHLGNLFIARRQRAKGLTQKVSD